nr:ribonuclease H-like domain-containing protein [Tanacetum cinerariifolium]
TLELQKDWYHKTQLALEEKVRILSANLENTTNTLKYSETLYNQAKIEKKEWEVKLVESLARTKLGLGFKEYFGSDEVFNLSTPSIFDHKPITREIKSLYERRHSASLEESTKWHRRMARVNFKTINKLAKLGLVEGLPLKLFTNDHNCVACNKGKQHKASYKVVSAAFFLGTKDETFYILKDFIALVENQLNKKTEAVSTACYVLNRVSITNLHNKTPYELLSGKIPNIRHLKPFGCQVTILNTSNHLGKFKGKANDGFLVGYAAHSYTRFKTNPPAGPDDTNILAGTQADDSDSKQEYEAHSTAAKHGFEFSIDTAALLPQANIGICRNLVPAMGDPTGGIVPTGGVPAGSDPASSVPTGGVLAGSSVPASDVPVGSFPARSVPADGVLAGSLVSTDYAASSVPAASVLVPAVVSSDSAATYPLPPVHSLGSCAYTT